MSRLIHQLALFCCLLFVITACSQPSSGKLGSATAHSTSQADTFPPMHLPGVAPGASCPTTPETKVSSDYGITQGKGPAYATIGADVITTPAIFHYLDAQHFGGGGTNNQGWGGQKVLWFVNPGYQGHVLVRGHQLDGSHEIRFDIDNQPLQQQLKLNTTLGGSPWPNFPSYTRLQAPGCYAYQIDGDTFSYVIIFQAVLQN